jgi:alpha-N-arabinofuranosidase
MELSVDLRSFGGLSFVEHILLHHNDVNAINSEQNPKEVVPLQGQGGKWDQDNGTIMLLPLSWNVIRFCQKD